MVLIFSQAAKATTVQFEAQPKSTVAGGLNTARTVILQQAETIAARDETIAMQKLEIETKHKARVIAEEALARAEDETKAAHLQWMECLEKLGIAEMSRELTYLVPGGRR